MEAEFGDASRYSFSAFHFTSHSQTASALTLLRCHAVRVGSGGSVPEVGLDTGAVLTIAAVYRRNAVGASECHIVNISIFQAQELDSSFGC